MTKLQLHVVCAVCAAARAIDAANDERRNVERRCGGWVASFKFEDGGMSVALTAPEADLRHFMATSYVEIEAPLRALTGDSGDRPIYGVPSVKSLHVTEEKIVLAFAAAGFSIRELPRTGVNNRLTFDWREFEPTQYSGLTRAEILALPKVEHLAAYKANPGETVSHYDCRCPKCKRRYAVDCLVKDADAATKCPRCERKEAQGA